MNWKILTLTAILCTAFAYHAEARPDCKAVFPNEVLNEKVDAVNLPFENDAELIGRWEAVDFVQSPKDFNPKQPNYNPEELFLKEIIFLPEGKILNSRSTWTKGHILDPQDQTDELYELREINGTTYLFRQWKSGDYICLGKTPFYYVLKKTNGIRMDDINLSFKNDKKVLGKWKTIDFVFNPADFTPGEKNWAGELYMKTLTFLPKGKTPQSPYINWTKGKVIHNVDQTVSAYEIKKINGKEFMFFEWKSGDYTFRGKDPAYYVLERMD